MHSFCYQSHFHWHIAFHSLVFLNSTNYRAVEREEREESSCSEGDEKTNSRIKTKWCARSFACRSCFVPIFTIGPQICMYASNVKQLSISETWNPSTLIGAGVFVPISLAEGSMCTAMHHIHVQLELWTGYAHGCIHACVCASWDDVIPLNCETPLVAHSDITAGSQRRRWSSHVISNPSHSLVIPHKTLTVQQLKILYLHNKMCLALNGRQ